MQFWDTVFLSSKLLWLYPWPDYINEAVPGLFLVLFPPGIPCPQAEETDFTVAGLAP